MRVLHLINTLIVGGAETMVVDSVAALRARHPGDEHYVVTVYQGGPLQSRVEQGGTPYLNLGFRKHNPLAAIRRLRRFVRDHRIDIVHAHLYEAAILARLALPRGVKLVSTYHTTFHDPASIDFSWRRLVIDRLTYRKVHSFIFVADSVRDDHLKRLPLGDNAVVLKNFTSAEFRPLYRYRPDGDLRLVCVGNYRLQKNHALAVEALATLPGLPVSLDIYGQGGPLQADLQRRIDQTGVKVRLVTGARITSEMLAGYDALLMTSLHEGMSIALLEAIRTGLPSLLNDIPSFRETARDAALYFERDSPASLARLLERCCRDRALLKAAAERAAVYAEEFTIDRYVEALRAIYGRLLLDHRVGADGGERAASHA
jgi:glycosyltransferase involved in cell wall biosynthesis